MTRTAYFHLRAFAKGCGLRIWLNGMELVAAECRGPRHFAPPINHWLIGSGNRVDVEASSLDEGDARGDWHKNAAFEGTVSAYQPGQAVGPESPGTVLVRFARGELSEDEQRLAQVRRSVRFDNAGPNCRARLCESDAIVARPHCDGRIWEVRRASGRPLIWARRTSEGLSYSIRVFVGMAGGRLRVVR